MEFFRHCPECGRRFHIKLESKKLVGQETVSVPTKKIVRSPYRNPKGSMTWGPPTVVVEGNPIIVDIDNFLYSYKCGHCGHEWSERQVEEHKVGQAQ